MDIVISKMCWEAVQVGPDFFFSLNIHLPPNALLNIHLPPNVSCLNSEGPGKSS